MRITAYAGQQLQPGEDLLALIVISAPAFDGKSDLIFRATEYGSKELRRHPPIARAEIYRRLRQLVDEFALVVEGPMFTGSIIDDCAAAVDKATGTDKL